MKKVRPKIGQNFRSCSIEESLSDVGPCTELTSNQHFVHDPGIAHFCVYITDTLSKTGLCPIFPILRYLLSNSLVEGLATQGCARRELWF